MKSQMKRVFVTSLRQKKKPNKPIGLFWVFLGFLIGFVMGFVMDFYWAYN